MTDNIGLNYKPIQKGRFIAVHGMNDFHAGKHNIDKLKPHVEELYNIQWVDFDYRWFGPVSVLLFNDNQALRLIEMYKPGDVIGCFSNGVSIVARAIDMGLPVEHCIFIHGSLPTEWEPHINSKVKRIDVFYSTRDKVGILAQLFRLVNGPLYYGPLMSFGHTKKNPIFLNHWDDETHSSAWETEIKFVQFIESLTLYKSVK